MKRLKFWPTVIGVALVLTCTFIWGQSFKDIPASRAESMAVLDTVKPVIEPIVGSGNVTDQFIRKLAHFIEFGALGGELIAFIAVRKRMKLQSMVNCLFAGLSVAVIDETIQIFSNRGSQVQDVLLDFAGCCTGMLFAGLIVLVVLAIRHRTVPR